MKIQRLCDALQSLRAPSKTFIIKDNFHLLQTLFLCNTGAAIHSTVKGSDTTMMSKALKPVT
ncbi:MAG: hypothetical protein JST21_13900 [Bacteroidetes bacterium]|nr:hypothetical protein [Bacteroidota bacterium]